MMATEPTVTITIDEYFDLRQKAESNVWLMKQLGEIEQRMFEFDRRLSNVEFKSNE